jgi:hypothetical protein
MAPINLRTSARIAPHEGDGLRVYGDIESSKVFPANIPRHLIVRLQNTPNSALWCIASVPSAPRFNSACPNSPAAAP